MAIRNEAFPQIPEEELVLVALLGNMAAFDELVRRYRGAVVRVAMQVLGSRQAAEDVAQETFLLAYKALPQLQDPARFAGWLYAIALHRARRVVRKECRSEAVERSQLDRLILAHCPEMTVNPSEVLIRKNDRAQVPAMLKRLPDEYRIALELRYYEEWPVAHIADFLSLPITTVKWRLHYGRNLMRSYLTETKEISHGRKRHGHKTHPTPVE